ncbi:MAG: biotin transporter BioY [Wolbachia endosymbiont of Tyrophagus putrescentiae]|nr:biotin transporter BioY [Wolbachia endosymbiont of Tyrophagus putrescentiae]
MLAKLRIANQLAEVLLCVLLLFLMSQISIPLQPVPITLQTLGVMIIGLRCNRKVAFYSVLTYLSLGAIGCPVFVNFSSGIIRPTTGYFIGFLVAVSVMNSVSESLKNKALIRNLLSCIAGTITIFVCGISWLAVYLGLKQAIVVGLLPFIIPGIVKILLLVGVLQYLNHDK